MAIGRSGVGKFLVENPTCRDFTTAQPTKTINYTPDMNRRQDKTCLMFKSKQLTTFTFSKFPGRFFHLNSSRDPLHNYLSNHRSIQNPEVTFAIYDSSGNSFPRKCRALWRYGRSTGLIFVQPRPRALTTRPATNRHRRNTYDISPAHQLEHSTRAEASAPRSWALRFIFGLHG